MSRENLGAAPSGPNDLVRKKDQTSSNITDATSVGRSLITATDAAAARTAIGVDNTVDAARSVLSATKLTTARTINGVSFDGTANITVADSTKEPTITAGLSTQYYRGDKSFQTLNADAVPDGTTNKAFLATERTKLTGIATAATANSADATLLARANHTGTQLASTISDFSTAVTGITGTKGAANGYASLDGGGKVPITQLPSSIMEYQGVWNASTNTPTLANSTGSAGDVYRVSVAGTALTLTFDVGDYVIYNGSTWEKSDTTDAVATVAGRTGNVTLAKSDVGLGNVDNTSDATAFAAIAALTNKDLTSATNTFPTLNQSTTGSAAKWTTARLLAGNSVDGSATVAFANKFIAQGTTDTGLSAAQFLGALGTGIVKNTTTTGVLSIAVAADFPTLNQSTTGTAANVTGTVALANGGTGQTTAATAITALTGTQTAGRYLRSDGTNAALAAIVAGDVPTLNQSTTGSAATLTTSRNFQTNLASTAAAGFTGAADNTHGVTGTLAVGNGGTGAITLTGLVKGTGTTAMVAATAGTDYVVPGGALGTPSSGTLTNCTFPTLNQNTTGSAASLSATLSIATGGTGQTTAAAAITALTGTQTAGRYLRSDGTNATLAAIVAADVPTLNQSTTGTAANVTGTVAVANGGTGLATLTANNVLLGNGTGNVLSVAPGTSGNVLTSNGTTWVSSAATGGSGGGGSVTVVSETFNSFLLMGS